MNTDKLIGHRGIDFHFMGTCVVTLQDSILMLVGMHAWYSLPTCCSSESGVASETGAACVSSEARGTSGTCNSRRSTLVFSHAHVMHIRIGHAVQMRCRMRTSVAGETSEAGEAGGTCGTCEAGVSSIACTQKPVVAHRSACISTRPAKA